MRKTMLLGWVLGWGVLSAIAGDWAQWRGPAGNGISDEHSWSPKNLIADKGPKVLWKINVGKGHSAVSVLRDRCYTMGNDGSNDIVYCLKTSDGSEIWQRSYPCRGGGYPGPRATPVVDGNLVYCFSREGDLHALDTGDGSVKWKVNVQKEFGAKNIKWGFSSTPRIEGNLLLLNACRHGIALDKRNGEKVWASPSGAGGYAVPVVYDSPEGKGVAIFGLKAIYGVDLKTGRKRWEHEWVTKHDVNAADPIVVGQKVFISSGYGKGAALVDFSGGRTREVWRKQSLSNHFSTSLLFDGHIYGFDGNTGRGTFRCFTFDTGEEKWSKDLGFGSLIAADGKLIILNEKGRLYIIEATAAGYREMAQRQAMNAKGAKCWTAPVLSRGRLYLRHSNGDVVCLDLEERR